MVGFRREQYLGKELRYIRSNGFTRTEVASLRGGARCVESKKKKKKKLTKIFWTLRRVPAKRLLYTRCKAQSV